MTMPTVSVIIPTYNRAELLPRAFDSVIAQTFTDWEIVLVDDGSADHTAEVARTYANRLGNRFVYLRHPHAGASSARNRGIDEGRGRFVAFLDSDDEFLPTKLERQLALFERCPELGLVYCDFACIDLEGARYDSVFDAKWPLARQVPLRGVAPRMHVCRGSLFDTLIRGYFVATIVGMVRREVLGDSIRFPADRCYAEEWLFYLKVARACQAGFVDESLCLHHYLPGSLARTDKHQNAVGWRNILVEAMGAFPDMTWQQRRVIRGNLALACRQLGFSERRAGNGRIALACLAESFRYGPGLRALYYVFEAATGALVESVTRADRQPGGPQELTDRVR